jgi:hypothetical protein
LTNSRFICAGLREEMMRALFFQLVDDGKAIGEVDAVDVEENGTIIKFKDAVKKERSDDIGAISSARLTVFASKDDLKNPEKVCKFAFFFASMNVSLNYLCV